MARKRKKKVFNTIKKEKHVHKSVSIDRFIDSINNPKCMKCQSIFAVHSDRNYCGKCQVSLIR